MLDAEGKTEDEVSKLIETVGCGDCECDREALGDSEGLGVLIADTVCTLVFVPREVKLGL